MGINLSNADQLFNSHIAAASRGSAEAYFELGVAYSTGTDGCEINMIEAHKWLNLAALSGVREGSLLRAEIERGMKLMGAKTLADLGPHNLRWR